jgi:hypothetical protein
MTTGRNMEEIITNDRGGSQSNIGVRYDLIPGAFIRGLALLLGSGSPARLELIPLDVLHEIALVLTSGAERYGDDNWKLIEPRDHVNHAINHLFLWLDGDRTENHLGNAACRCLFAVWAAKYSEG